MSTVAHIIQCAIVGGTLLAVLYFFYALVRADLRANPPMAVACDEEAEGGDDPGAEWDRGHDRWVDREMGAA